MVSFSTCAYVADENDRQKEKQAIKDRENKEAFFIRDKTIYLVVNNKESKNVTLFVV